MTLFYHIHDGDYEIRPNEPNLIIGVYFLEKTHKNKRKIIFWTIGEAVDYVIVILQDLHGLARFLQDWHRLARSLQEYHVFQETC